MANEQTKSGSQTDTTTSNANQNEQSMNPMAGFDRTQLPDGRMSFAVPASIGQAIEPKRLLWYGGLAALGVVGVLEWPVVAVVGAATYVSERFARDDQQAQH